MISRFLILLVIIIIPTISLAQITDTIYYNNGTLQTGELLQSMIGKGPQDDIDAVFERSVVQVALDQVERVIQDNVTFVRISFKIGQSDYPIFANQYYFGSINLYEGKVSKLGWVQIIEKEGKNQVLLAENYNAILQSYLGSCYPNDYLPAAKYLDPSDLITIMDQYHSCMNEAGKSEKLKEKKSIQFMTMLSVALTPVGSVNFGSNQFQKIKNNPELKTGNSLENSEWDMSFNPNVFLGVFAKSTVFKFGPVFKYSGYSMRTDYYNIAPFEDEDVYSEFEFIFNNISVGLQLTYQPKSYKKLNPYLNLALFTSVYENFDYKEIKYESSNYTNLPLTISNTSPTSFLFGLGCTIKKFGFEMGYHNTTGTLLVNGPSYEENFTSNQYIGYDEGNYSINQVYLNISYHLFIGGPKTWNIYH